MIYVETNLDSLLTRCGLLVMLPNDLWRRDCPAGKIFRPKAGAILSESWSHATDARSGAQKVA